jgi:Fe-Mn family superoxide dismutase
MRLHHDKHHQAYVTNINAAVANYSSAPSLADQIALQSAINFNGGGHINHSLFWRNLAPANSSDASAPAAAAPSLAVAVDAEFGSFDAMIDVFSKELVAVQGSGWGWLVKEEKGGSLRIVTREDQDPVVEGEVPIIGVDVWEHAYYLQVSRTFLEALSSANPCSTRTAALPMSMPSGPSSTGQRPSSGTRALATTSSRTWAST